MACEWYLPLPCLHPCKERRSLSLLMAQRDNVLVPLTKGDKSK